MESRLRCSDSWRRRARALTSGPRKQRSRSVSHLKYADILALARQSDAVIYAIGILGDSPTEEEEDGALLKRLCKDSGGLAYFPHTPAEIASVSKLVADDLREQYTVGFEPAERKDARAFRKIEVKVVGSGAAGLRVRTRSGYLSAGAKP